MPRKTFKQHPRPAGANGRKRVPLPDRIYLIIETAVDEIFDELRKANMPLIDSLRVETEFRMKMHEKIMEEKRRNR